MRAILFVLLLLEIQTTGAPKKVAVFVALCDNASQGIVPVPQKIGDGNKPQDNLYWGCTDGFSGCFRASKAWRLKTKEVPLDPRILERVIYLNQAGTMELTAEAWRGSEIRACLSAFEAALVSGNHDLCAYVGHNVLMDMDFSPPPKGPRSCDAIVLCCLSETYFKDRLAVLGARPVMLTTQLMYPGSFLLHDSLPLWASGRPPSEMRQAAAAAYARNQGISKKAAAGVFAALP